MYELTRILVILGWGWLGIVAVFIAGYDWAERVQRRRTREAAVTATATLQPAPPGPFTEPDESSPLDRQIIDRRH